MNELIVGYHTWKWRSLLSPGHFIHWPVYNLVSLVYCISRNVYLHNLYCIMPERILQCKTPAISYRWWWCQWEEIVLVPACCVCVCVMILLLSLFSVWRCVSRGRRAEVHQLSSQQSSLSVTDIFTPDLVAEPNQTVMEVNRTDSLMTVSAGWIRQPAIRRLGRDAESWFILVQGWWCWSLQIGSLRKSLALSYMNIAANSIMQAKQNRSRLLNAQTLRN